VVTSFLLGIEKKIDFIAGFSGSRQTSLAVMRGEADLVAFTFESILNRIEAGDLRPLLQVSDQQISPHHSLKGVPILGGEKGLAVKLAATLGRNVAEAEADTMVLCNLIGSGTFVAAPKGLELGLFQCLEKGLYDTLSDPAFKEACAAANRSLHVVRADAALANLKTVAKRSEKFLPIIREAIKKVRE